MPERWVPILKIAALVLGCWVLWEGSRLFDAPAAGQLLGQDIATLELAIAKAQRSPSAGSEGPAEPKPLAEPFVQLAKAGAFGKKPKPKPPAAPPEPELVGIAGDTVFIKTPSGATKPFLTGDEQDGIRLLKIGLNRVLIEKDGDKRELTMFSGLGSETLLEDDPSSASDEENQQ